MQVIFAARLLRSGDVWQPHPGGPYCGNPMEETRDGRFWYGPAATEASPSPVHYHSQPKRDTRAAVVLLALGYKPRRRHQDEEHDDGEAMVSPPSTELVSPGSLNRTSHIAFRGQYRKPAKGGPEPKQNSRLRRRFTGDANVPERSAPPVASTRHNRYTKHQCRFLPEGGRGQSRRGRSTRSSHLSPLCGLGRDGPQRGVCIFLRERSPVRAEPSLGNRERP
jgi:hypothetical protein